MSTKPFDFESFTFIETGRDDKYVHGYQIPNFIVCAGTHGGGKTVLTERLAKRFGKKAITHSRPTRAAQIMGFERAGDVPPEQKALHQLLSLFEQVAAERDHPKGFIADRGVIDFLAYYVLTVPVIEQERAYRQAVEFYAKRYELIVYVPPNSKGVESNGVRFERLTHEVDQAVQRILHELNLTGRVLQIRTDTPEERELEVVDHLQRVWKAAIPIEKHEAKHAVVAQPAP